MNHLQFITFPTNHSGKGPGPTVTVVAAEHRPLLPAYIQEARGILGNVPLQVSHLHAHPHKQSVLAALQRGFQTLNVRSRKLGLDEFATVARDVERVLNRYLQDRRPADMDLLKFIRLVADANLKWVRELETQGRAQVTSAALAHLAQSLRACDQEPPV